MVNNLMDNLGIRRSSGQANPTLQPDSETHHRNSNYISNDYHDHVIQQLSESFKVHDLCLIGSRGSGKSTLVMELAKRLSLDIEPIMLYQVIFFYLSYFHLVHFILIIISNDLYFQDMTARDLLQQRSTMPNGDTVWRPSPLLTAAMEGKIAVMDGLHRLNTGTLFSIHRYFDCDLGSGLL